MLTSKEGENSAAKEKERSKQAQAKAGGQKTVTQVYGELRSKSRS